MTMTMTIKPKYLHQCIADMKRMGIRHYPFQKNAGDYEITLYPKFSAHTTMLRLKYCVDNPGS